MLTKPFVARAAHLVALNAGGRLAASERGWIIVDAERMSSGFAEPSVSLDCVVTPTALPNPLSD